ncbi:nuclear transport factor 2-like isoform X2 [Primulina tabacum]|uniref:nuclear transport factor 2-like isoform X2 n=1 Tax=Primulina tabacum TaxID=48773 RepID=UPI003F59D605
MTTHGAAPVTVTQIGSYFVQQYYQVFQQQRDYVHQFYTDESSMIRIDGDTVNPANDMMQIHQLIMSLDFTGIEIKTINSLQSWNEGVLVVVTGSLKSRDSTRWKKFVQTFFLAPQEKGYFVLNDMFHFGDEEVGPQPSAPAVQEQASDYKPTVPTNLPDPPDYALEEEARDYVNSVHIEGDEPDHEYGYQEFYHQEPEPEPEPEHYIEGDEPEHEYGYQEVENPEEENSDSHQSTVTAVPEAQLSLAQLSAEEEPEPVLEPEKLTYASILRAKGKSSSTVSYPPPFPQSTPYVSDWNHVSPPLPQQSIPSALNTVPDVTEEAFSQDEGESKSVYVRNLPSTVTTLDILQEFKIFGKIKQDGVFLRNRKDTGVCYAFVEFEDLQSVHNAIKASPLQLTGRQVYIEERRSNSGPTRGGRGRGRGRGGLGGRTFGRGGDQNGSDNSSRLRANGFRGI